MSFTLVSCSDIATLKIFLEKITFSTIKSSMLSQFSFQHYLVSLKSSSYLLVDSSEINEMPLELTELLPPIQFQVSKDICRYVCIAL